ncbi:hypothetical protein N8990_06785 [Candidatus Pelagibacter sp.]|nr:hypothetical protein [Candidatus Pelagibacter sp.]
MKKKVNIAILIGRAGSKGLPGKNTKKILGRFLVEYPLIAAKNSKLIKYLFVSTDCSKIKKISKNYHAINLERPKYLATSLYALKKKAVLLKFKFINLFIIRV